MKSSGAYRHVQQDMHSTLSSEVYRTGIMATLQNRERAVQQQRERKIAVDRRSTGKKNARTQNGTTKPVMRRRGSVAPPMLSANHPLVKARVEVELAIQTYQAMVHLENADHHHHRSMPIPRILSGEANSYATLANVLRMLSTLCESRSTAATQYVSERGETSVELFERATQMCDVAMGIAGSLGNHEVEAFAIKSLSDLAEARHVYDVARWRLDRAIATLKLMPDSERRRNGGRGNRLLANMMDTKRKRALGDADRAAHLERLRGKPGSAAMAEESKVTTAFLEVVQKQALARPKLYEDGEAEEKDSQAAAEEEKKDPKEERLDSRGFLEWSELMGCYPPMSDMEVNEAMAQICAGKDTLDINKNWHEMVTLEALVVWWLESLNLK